MAGQDELILLEEALAAVESTGEGEALILALMTPTEIVTLRHRWSAFQLSVAGAKQRAVRDLLGVSIATASRAARVARENPAIIETLVKRCRVRRVGRG